MVSVNGVIHVLYACVGYHTVLVVCSYLFWSDWNSYIAFLGRIGMDGSQQTKIVTTDIYWPNCLSVDYTSDRLFWVDAQTVRLEYVSYLLTYLVLELT